MHKEKHIIRITLSMIILAIFFTSCAQAAPILSFGPSPSVSLEVNNIYGYGSDSATTTFLVYNNGVAPLTITDMDVTEPTGVTVTILSVNPITIPIGSSSTVTVKAYANSNVNEGSQKAVITVITSAETDTIDLNLNIKVLIPAKLGSISDKSTTITFNKPKGTVGYFYEDIPLQIQNIGDTVMTVKSISVTNPTGGVTAIVSGKPNTISSRNSATATIEVTVSSNTAEGTQTCKILVNAGTAGSKTLDLKVKIKHGIIMSVSVSKIDFGDTKLYESSTKYVTVSEDLGYKSVLDIKSYYYPKDKWLTADNFDSLPAGSSKNIPINVLFDGNAKTYYTYKWNYKITTSNAGSITIPITARMIFEVNLDELQALKEESSGETYEIVNNMYFALNSANEYAKKHPSGSMDELINIMSISDALVDVLESYNDANSLIANGDHDSAFNDLIRGSVGIKMINTYSEKVTDEKLKDNIDYVNSHSSTMMEVLIQKETKYYENMLNADNSNTLQKMNAYSRLSELWGLMGDATKEKEYKDKADEQYEQYSTLVDTAKNERLESEGLIIDMQNSILSNWGDKYVMINPFNYDDLSNNYDLIVSNYIDAESKYRSAGEIAMADKTPIRLKEIKGVFKNIFIIFYALTSFYTILFGGTLTKCVKGFISYRRDDDDVHLGDYLVI